MSVDAKFLVQLIVALREAVAAEQQVLNTLDAALGDGDHGTGLNAGFAAAAARVRALQNPTPTEVFRATALALMNAMGGSSGALYGTFFLKAGGALEGKFSLSGEDWAAALQAGLTGVMERGQAQPGGKTLVDALHPAVAAFVRSVGAGQPVSYAFQAATRAADAGAQATAEMVARFGRARFVGDRALGHVDAGAASMALVLRTMSACCGGHR